MNFLMGLALLVSVAFLLRFLLALSAESRRTVAEKMSVHMITQPIATVIEIKDRPRQKADVSSNITRIFGERVMRTVAVIIAVALCGFPLHAQDTASQSNAISADEVRELRQLVQELKAKIDRLEKNAESQPVPQSAPDRGLQAAVAVPREALVETNTSPQAATPEKPKKAEPFAYADWTWMNGNPRTKDVPLDTKFFTPDIRFDAAYVYDFNHPKDDTIGGSAEVFRAQEFQLTQLGVGGDFHFDNVRGRLMTQFGMYSQTQPRNDASPSRGQWSLDGAYRYLAEAYGGYHFDVNHGLNVDAGIFMSYIGLFSWYNFDNWAYQPSYVSSNTPFFFNGLRVQWFPTEKLKIEPWLINGWQSYGRFNSRPGLGFQIAYRPNGKLTFVSNGYGIGADTLGNPDRIRYHSDSSVEYKYYDRPDRFLDKAAFSLTGDIGCEHGGGVSCAGNSTHIVGGESVVWPKQSFLGFMIYNRLWFAKDRYGFTLGGGKINNPGRYLVLIPPINGATAASGTPYFTANPGDPFKAWDATATFDYMPSQYITFRWEFNHRAANVPYFSGRGGITPAGGNQGTPGSLVDGFTPDLRKDENRLNMAVMVKF